MTPLRLEFCGDWYDITEPAGFSIGRESDLVIDDNPYLHRRFLQIYPDFGMWWLGNVGKLLSATVSDTSGHVQAWLSPGARLPIVFEKLHVLFTAGTTTYDFTIHSGDDFYSSSPALEGTAGQTTFEPVPLTSSQRLIIVALAEDILRQRVPGRGEVPTSSLAAARIGWNLTTFNRKLDNVCDKLDRMGVPGLHGGRGKLASNRRARLVEYALATHMIGAEDLVLLDAPAAPEA